jgi:hypothetical protein
MLLAAITDEAVQIGLRREDGLDVFVPLTEALVWDPANR